MTEGYKLLEEARSIFHPFRGGAQMKVRHLYIPKIPGKPQNAFERPVER